MPKFNMHAVSANELRRRLETVLNSNRLMAQVLQAAQNELAIIADLTDRKKVGPVMIGLHSPSIVSKVFAIARNWRDKPPMLFQKPTDSKSKEAALPVDAATGPSLDQTIKAIEDEPVPGVVKFPGKVTP